MAIFVDKSLTIDVHRQNFTFSHEFGHLVLHRELKLKGSDPDIKDTERDLITGKKKLVSPIDWVEWQANKFASCFLLPRSTVITALVTKQLEMGIRKNLGTIYLENRTYSYRDCETVIGHLQDTFMVSKTVVRIRLEELGLLLDKRPKPSHIAELFRCESA